MIVLATGISGVGKRTYFQQVKKLGKENDLDIAVYDCGKLLFDVANKCHIDINPKNILNMPDLTLTALMGGVYQKIASDIKNHEHAIISTHAHFYWDTLTRDSNNHLFLNDVKPDLFITMIDTPNKILSRLSKDEKWKPQNFSLENIIHWQDYEMSTTSGSWAGIFGTGNKGKPTPYLALPREQPSESLVKLIKYPEIKPVYCAFPMTNLEEKDSYQKVNEFIQAGGGPLLGTDVGLRDFYVVIDPRTYELKMGATEIENAHTVHRDLKYFVGQTKATICYFPEIVPSSGANAEMKEAHSLSKDVYLIMNKEERSPFVDFHLTHEIFKEPKKFFEFLKEQETVRELKRPNGYKLDL